MTAPTIVIGAGLGGARVCAALRTQGHDGPITLIGAEPHLPYDRPPLSKEVLRGEIDSVALESDDLYQSLTVLTGTAVTDIDTVAHTVATDRDGVTDTLEYRDLVIATGLRPRTLVGADLDGIHVLRSLEDAHAIRDAARSARTAVIIGAGFIGCEVAASLTALGVSVTVVEPQPQPLAMALGEQVGALVSRLHADHGVTIITNATVSGFTGHDHVQAVALGDGSNLPADLVVLGIGSSPATELAERAGIELAPADTGGGILCDAHGATSAADVYALGDVANWPDSHGQRHRVEHWNNVVDQSIVVAQAICGTDDPAPETVPYFWSDQHGIKIQALGHPRADDDITIVSDDGTKWVAYYSRDGIFTGVVGAGKAGAVMKMRRHLTTPTPIADVIG